MIVAGAALLPGGSPLGLLILVPGVAIAWAGTRLRPVVEAPGWMRLIGTAIALVTAVFLVLDGGVVTSLVALVIAAFVAMSNSRVTRPQTSTS